MSKDSKIKKEIAKINEPSRPNAGASTPASKLNPKGEGEPFAYQFNTNNKVREAKPRKGATRSCADKQSENTVTHPTAFPSDKGL